MTCFAVCAAIREKSLGVMSSMTTSPTLYFFVDVLRVFKRNLRLFVFDFFDDEFVRVNFVGHLFFVQTNGNLTCKAVFLLVRRNESRFDGFDHRLFGNALFLFKIV